jgi:hypothetical protein
VKPIAVDLAPLHATCANCGGPLTIYSYPLPRGTAHCAACSPPWLLDFLLYQEDRRQAKAKGLA